MTEYLLEVTPKKGASLDEIMRKIYGLLGKNIVSMDQIPGKKNLAVVCVSDLDRAEILEKIGYILEVQRTDHIA